MESSSIAGFVCLSLCVIVTHFFTMFLSLDPHETYTDSDIMKCLWHVRFQVTRSTDQGLRGHLKFLSCQFRGSVPIWPNKYSDMTMCHDPFPGQKFKGRGRSNHLKWRSHRLLEVFSLSAPCLHPYLAESLHMWYTYNTWGDNVSHAISGSKCQRSSSHGSFEVLGLSTTWLRSYLTESRYMWYTYNA